MALQHYEAALRCLEDADERAALEALDFAEVFLARAQDDDVRRGLVAEVSLARGALLEVADPTNARLAYDRSYAADGNAAAALRAARLAWRCGDDEAACEALLKRARAAAADDEEARGDAAELLGRFLAERGRVHEVHELAELGYDRTFSREALTNALHAVHCEDAPARLFDDALPANALAALRRALRPSALYWRETDYGSPAVGFFSFTHRIDALSDTALEGVLQAIWRAAAKALPEARHATYVEWWAHTRRRGDGHALHYDSVPGLTEGAPPRHPLASTVTFLEASVGGPTLIFDQTVANKRSTRAWVAAARPNRLLVFDGSLLHGVLPGGRGEGRRTTFMANFWRDDPRAGDASDREATRGTNVLFPPPHCDWPADFAERVGDVEIRCEGCAAPAVALEDVVTRLDGGAVAPGDLLTDGTFFDCLETIGCEARAGGADEDVAAAPARQDYGRYEIGAGAAGLGSSSSDDGSDEDGGMPTYGYGCIACHHAADGCIACRAVDDRCFGDDFGPTADVDYSDSSSEDDEALARDAAARRIEAVISRARAAGVPGAEKYDGAWIAKSVRQAACPEIFADRVEDTIVKRILAARTGTKRSIREAAAQARARRKARRQR